MQLGLTHDQISFIKDWVKDPTIVAVLWWALRRGSNKGLHWLQGELLLNVKDYIGKQFVVHQMEVSERFDDLDKRFKVMERRLRNTAPCANYIAGDPGCQIIKLQGEKEIENANAKDSQTETSSH